MCYCINICEIFSQFLLMCDCDTLFDNLLRQPSHAAQWHERRLPGYSVGFLRTDPFTSDKDIAFTIQHKSWFREHSYYVMSYWLEL